MMDKQHPFYMSLERSIALALQLENALAEETSAIERRDADLLQQVVAAKKGIVMRLEQETQLQRQQVENSGQAFTPQGLDVFLTALDDSTRTLITQWNSLRQVIVRCDLMNKTNARLIERHRQRVATTIQLLRGDDGNGGVYTPKGQTTPITVQRRTLSRA
ncbi:flagella synthesis protein FlgN [Thiospirillum jenense]|uniref:Flagellar protein FlgN n=1 Tax=Thiospirillum jenense TaxID=1653858 RepID=A0A839HJ25_9GAMM|nr:flagellar protein FlgN [Thiospirillum jenense]MBB1126649.1 flagellar protein FlgN [Thiospirillum jenense]